MKKNSIFTFLLILLITGQLFSQVVVKHIDEVHHKGPLPVIPDVEGYILLTEDYFTDDKVSDQITDFELFPGWPLNYSGSSSRGGAYCNIDEDDDLEIVYNVSQQVYAWNIDGTVVPGWPQSVSLYPDGAPAYGDIDGDGVGEIVVSSRQTNNGFLTAFEHDGSLVDGFPVTLTGGATKTPVLADLDGDGIHEIIIEERNYPDGYVGVYKGNGSTYPGFPVPLDYIPGSAVAVGDITGDGIPEIIAESYYSVIAFDNNGNTLEGFPVTPGNDRVFSYSSPVLADLNGDGTRDILVGDHSLAAGNGAIHALNYDGTPLEGWPKYTSHWIYGPAAVGDIDGDGNLDVAVGDQVLSGSPVSKVYVWDKDGNNLSGWPVSQIWAVNNQVLLTDLDGDNMVELMWDDNTSSNIYLGYNHDGSPMEGWPLTLLGSSFFMNPFAADVNNDGLLDVSGASGIINASNLHFYLWNTGVSVNPEASPLTILQYNNRHDGVYSDLSALSAGFTALPIKVCEGGEVQFSDQSTGEVTSWEWTFEGGDPVTSTEQNPLITYTMTGQYDVSLSVSDGSQTSTTTIEDYIKVAYNAEIPEQPSGPSNFSTDTANFTYYTSFSPNAEDYIWELIPDDVGVITDGDSASQVKIYWSSEENYTAELQVKAINVCGESEFSEPLLIHVNWTIGIDEKNNSEYFSIQPNPFYNELSFYPQKKFKHIQITLFDFSGRKIFSSEYADNGGKAIKIKLSDINSGAYLLEFRTDQGIYLEKILKK